MSTAMRENRGQAVAKGRSNTTAAPIAHSPGRTNPRTLALFGVLATPLVIPTLAAVVRAVLDLREVARRERDGHWDPEHPSVRADAVWTFAIVAAQCALVAIAVSDFAGEPTERRFDLEWPASEAEEIEAELRGGDREAVERAIEDLAVVAPQLPPGDLERFVSIAEDLPSRRDAVIRAIARAAPLDDRSVDRLLALYDGVGPRARAAVLAMVAQRGRPADFVEIAQRIRSADPDYRMLPVDALAAKPQAASVIAPALRFEPFSSHAAQDAIRLLAIWCRAHDVAPADLAPARAAFLERWSWLADGARSGPSGEGRGGFLIDEVRTQLDAMRCVVGAEYAETLADAMFAFEPIVAAVTTAYAIAEGAQVPHHVLDAVATRMTARGVLARELAASGHLETHLPAPYRTARAHAEAAVAQSLGDPMRPNTLLRWTRRIEGRRGSWEVIVIRDVGVPHAGEAAAVGPFASPARGFESHPRVVWAAPDAIEAAVADEERALAEEEIDR